MKMYNNYKQLYISYPQKFSNSNSDVNIMESVLDNKSTCADIYARSYIYNNTFHWRINSDVDVIGATISLNSWKHDELTLTWDSKHEQLSLSAVTRFAGLALAQCEGWHVYCNDHFPTSSGEAGAVCSERLRQLTAIDG